MKKQELQNIIDILNDIKHFSDNQEYNICNYLNTRLMQVLPLLNNELDRMTSEKITINCPALEIVDVLKEPTEKTLPEALNDKMRELVMSGYKIIDFGIFRDDAKKFSGYIKYTS